MTSDKTRLALEWEVLDVRVLDVKVLDTKGLDPKYWNEMPFYFGVHDFEHEPDCVCDICIENRAKANT
jgi:hypothetical protein